MQVELPDLPVVVQYLADDLAIGHHYCRVVRVAEDGGEEVDRFDLALDADDRDVLPNAERPGKYDRKARHQIAEHALHCQRNAGARHTQARNQRQELDAEILQRHDKEQGQYQEAHEAHEQQPYRRLEMELAQRAIETLAHPAPGVEAGDEDEDRDHGLGAELDREFDNGALGLFQGVELDRHDFSRGYRSECGERVEQRLQGRGGKRAKKLSVRVKIRARRVDPRRCMRAGGLHGGEPFHGFLLDAFGVEFDALDRTAQGFTRIDRAGGDAALECAPHVAQRQHDLVAPPGDQCIDAGSVVAADLPVVRGEK